MEVGEEEGVGNTAKEDQEHSVARERCGGGCGTAGCFL